jgi:OTU domain-containing protein 6
VEEEFATKLKDMEDRHRTEVAALVGSDTDTAEVNESSGTNNSAAATNISNAEDIAAMERQKKLEKIREQKELERQRIIEKERQSMEEAKNIGPTLRDIEIQQITQQLRPRHYKIQPIPADGNCLFRAIAAQCSTSTTILSYQDIRALCAQTMREHEEEFAPFCEYNDETDSEITNYKEYVNAVQYSSHHWGGHLEIRALSMALQRPVHVYSSNTLHTNGPLIIDGCSSATTSDATVEPIRLSYHLHYYALGEHYNQVVPAVDDVEPSNEER